MINGKKIVALCTYRIHDSQVFTFITEFSNLLSKFDCRLFIYAINAEIGNKCGFLAETSVYDLIHFDKVDAVVIMDEKIKSRETVRKIIDNAKKANVPAIVIDGEYDDVSTINFDYRNGFETVVRHVIEEHGARRPHFMAGKHNNKFSDERIDVFKQVLAENNIPFDDSMLSYGDFWSVPARAAAEEIIKWDMLPDAIICANDIMADLNGLKKINDNLGHSAGDSAIKAVATRLKDNCPEDALCLRHGGDEMVALIIGPCDPEKIKAGVDKDLLEDSKELGINVSAAIGYYVTKFDSNLDLNKAINAADEEMYKIKKQSR